MFLGLTADNKLLVMVTEAQYISGINRMIMTSMKIIPFHPPLLSAGVPTLVSPVISEDAAIFHGKFQKENIF